MANKKPTITAAASRVLREQVRDLLDKSGKTQAALAEALGHSPTWASEFLNGQTNITVPQIGTLADFFDVPMHVLFGSDLAFHTSTGRSAKHAGEGDAPFGVHANRKRLVQALSDIQAKALEVGLELGIVESEFHHATTRTPAAPKPGARGRRRTAS